MEGQDDVLRAAQKDVIPIRRSLDLLSISKGEKRKSVRKAASFESGDPLAEQLQWRGYDSDEEGVSTPADSDSYSICSASSGEIVEAVAVPARLSLFIPKTPTTDTPRTERQLYRAQAVIMRPMGKGTTAASPKLVDIPASPTTHRSSPSSSSRGFPFAEEQSQPAGESLHHDSFPSTPRTSSEGRSIDTTPSTPATSTDGASHILSLKLREQASFAPTEPVRVAAPDVTKGQSWRDFLTYDDPYPLTTQIKDHMFSPVIPTRRKVPTKSASPAKPAPMKGRSWKESLNHNENQVADPLAPTKQRLRKFTSAIGMGRADDRATINAYKGLTGSLAEAKPSSLSFAKSKSSKPAGPEVYAPSRPSTGSQRPKLVARGASEREPPLKLPPCPKGWDESQARPKTSRSASGPKSYAPSGAPMKLQKERPMEVGVAR